MTSPSTSHADISSDAHFLSANPADILPPTMTGTSDAVPSVMGNTGNTQPAARTDKIQHARSQVWSLVMWERPIQSAITLASLLVLNYALAYLSPLRVLSFVVGVATLANMIFVNAWVYGGSMFVNAQTKGVKKPPTMWFLDHANRNPVNHNLVREWTDFIVDVTNMSFSWLASIVAVDDNQSTAKALGLIGLVYLISGYVSSGTIATIAVVAGFALPRLYMTNQPLIDGHVARARDTVSKHMSSINQSCATYYDAAAVRAKAKMNETQARFTKKHEE